MTTPHTHGGTDAPECITCVPTPLFNEAAAATEDDRLITQRRKVYGDPEETFARIAQVWSGILGVEVRPDHVPLMQAGMKLVRAEVAPDYSDNSDDVYGYMDIFRIVVGDAMVKASSVDEYLAKKGTV